MLNNCLVCDNLFHDDRCFSDLIWPNLNVNPLCRDCRNKIELLSGKKCEDCGRISAAQVYQDCLYWRKKFDFNLSNRSLICYNDWMKEFMHQYKFVGDYRLRLVFLEKLADKFKKQVVKSDFVIPIPISEKTLKTRGFNQVTGLFDFAKNEMATGILQVKPKEQVSKLNRHQRLEKENLFYLDEVSIKNKSVLLLDDVYTTGMTLHQAAMVLYKAGVKKVTSITLAR
ncbi:ComF family protein [Oenococcus sp. UCMA 16435]|nr:ComF family protein [Oenococcus sp. UCMA 16435]